MDGHAFLPDRIGINSYKRELLTKAIEKGDSWIKVNKIEDVILEQEIVRAVLKGNSKQNVASEFNVTTNRVTRIFNKWISESIKRYSSFSYYT